MRWLRYTAYTIILIVIVLVILIILLLTTNTGLRVGFAMIRHVIPGKVDIAKINGKLIGPLELKGISYNNQDISVNVTRIDLNGSLLPLIFKDLDLKSLTIQGINYHALDNKNKKLPKKSEPFVWEGLPIRINIPAVNISDVLIRQNKNIKRINQISFGIKTSGQQVTVKQFKFVAPTYQATANGEILATKPFTTKFTAELSGHFNQEQFTDLQANVYGNIKKLTVLARTVKPFKSKANITLYNLTDKPSIDGNINWQNLTWIVDGFSSVEMKNGQVNIKGPINAYQFSAATDISGSKIPSGDWSMNGSGTYHDLRINQLLGKTLGGSLQASANLNWQSTISWQAKLHGEHINPGVKWQKWAADLNFTGALNGHYDKMQQHINSHLVISQFSGNLHKYTLSGQADINLQQQNLFIKQLYLNLGDNHLKASGKLTQQWNISWQANLPNLGAIWSSGHGQAKSEGHITGDKQHPVIRAYAEAKKVDLPWFSFDLLTSNIDMGSQPNQAANAQAEINNLHVHFHTIKQIKLMSEGTVGNQTITGLLSMPDLNINTQLTGGLNNNTWQGQLQKLNIETANFGAWQTKQNSQLNLGTKSSSITHTCLRSGSKSLCGEASWQPKQSAHASFKTTGLNLSMLKPLFPNNLSIDAPLNINMDINSNVNGQQSGHSEINIPGGKIAYTYQNSTQTFPIKNSSITSDLSTNGLSAQANIAIEPNQTLTGDINFPGFNLLKGWKFRQKFTGKLNLNAPDLSWLASIIAPLENTKGSIIGELSLTGDAQQPKLSGAIHLNNASLSVPTLGITPHDINLTARFNPDQTVVYSGNLISGDGKASIEGQTQLNAFLNSSLNIKGNNLLAINNQEYKASLSPDVKVTYSKPKLVASGHLNIPSATITPKTFEGTTTLPDNIIYIRQEKNKEPPLQFYLDVNLGLKDINIAYQGLKAKLMGQLKLRAEPESIMTASGELKTISGSYKAYNQDLTIKKANLIYTGGPINNPGIDMSAIRQIQTVFDNSGVQQTLTVGINATGSLRRPKIYLFSKPVTLSQADILSYIILGHGTNTASGGQGQLLLAAASSLGIQDNSLTQSIQKTFGLSELGFESNEVMNEEGTLQSNTSLVIGKKITPKLSIKYSAGLLVPVSVVRMIYQMSRHWSAQTNASTYDNGADVFYTIETD